MFLSPEGDWESSHYIMTGDTPQDGTSPQLPTTTTTAEPALGGGGSPMVPFGVGLQHQHADPELGLGISPQLTTFGLGAVGDEVGILGQIFRGLD